jgi:osmotically-inducible protein OsmY
MVEPGHALAPVRVRRNRTFAIAVLSLVACLGLLAYARGMDLREIGKKISSVRDTSLDVALKSKVQSALALSRRTAGMKIDVDARSGVVTLRGRVPTHEARAIVEAIVTDTPGVEEVHDEVAVDPQATATGYEQTLIERIGDLETQVALQERLRREPLLAGAHVRVDIEHGMVVLRGWAETDLESAGAQNIAEAAVGADHVRNEIDTVGGRSGGDDRLARRVEFELYATRAFDLSQIQIRSEAGKVKMDGAVRSEAERLLAGRLAEGVPGVGEVVNGLKVPEGALPDRSSSKPPATGA